MTAFEPPADAITITRPGYDNSTPPPRGVQRPRRATEAECQATLIAAAQRGGWMVHAERPAQVRSGRWATNVQGQTGWPDLALAHPARGFLLVELKRRPNRIEPAQQAWHDTLRAACIDVRVWWVPDDLDQHVAWLTERAA